MISYNWRRPAD